MDKEFEILSVDLRPEYRRPVVRVFAAIHGRRYELTCLTPKAWLEVYDHPPSWEGCPRFVGYASAEITRKLLSLAREWVLRSENEKGLQTAPARG